jgi:uncharacterized metal-binding protein YceD (DUF177 family)
VKSKKEYIIPFVGLKLGFHEFEYDVRDTFFEDREYSIIHSGNVNVKLVLEKKQTMLIGEFTVNGSVSTDCDRCNDPVEVPVNGQYRVVFKFDTEASDDETLIVLHPDSYEIDLFDTVYEFITVSLPSRSVHPKGECNQEMIELLAKYSSQKEESDEDDWDEDDDEDWDDDDDDNPIDTSLSALKNLN